MLDAPTLINQPPASLAAPGIGAALRRSFLATRPAFFVASIFPVLVGTVWAGAAYHAFDGLLFTLALAATLLVHAATNVWNDVGDDIIGADSDNPNRIYPYTGGSQFIQSGLLSRAYMVRLALALATAALVIGGLLTMLRGPAVLLFGLAGLALGVLYSLPGVQLSARGVGEAAVAVGFGALPVLGSEWLQAGIIDRGAVLLCIPVSAWVAAIVVINEVPDIDGDRRVHKRNLVVRFGAEGARWIYAALTSIALGASLIAVKAGVLPRWYAVPALALAAVAVWALTGISAAPAGRERLTRSIRITLAVHGIGGLSLIAAVWLARGPG
jgi:1,4-dihydroxy-2-naphthoate octaprenyltransferase